MSHQEREMTMQPYKTCRACGQRMVLSMQKCGRCGRPALDAEPSGPHLASSRPATPAAPAPTDASTPQLSLQARIGWYALFAVLVLAGLSVVPKGGGSDMEAWIMAKDFVRRELKAPSSADFPSMSEASVARTGDRQYTVEAWVESDNSFGAHLRSPFRCVLHSEGLGRWVCDDVRIGDEF